MRQLLRFTGIVLFCVGCSQTSQSSIGGTRASADVATLNGTLQAATVMYELVTRVEEFRVPQPFLQTAHCIIVMPNVLKAAFFAGANYGYGVASCRVGSAWSLPAFVSVTGGSVGLQIGAEQSDILLLMMDAESKQTLLSNKITLGVDVGISAGPVGEKVKSKTDTDLRGILAYSRSQGAFAGVSLEGAILSPDNTSNQVYYGENVTVEKILLKAATDESTEEAVDFLSRLPR